MGLYSELDGDGVMCMMDTVTMTKFQVAFSLDGAGKMMITMDLSTQYPASAPKCVLHQQKPGQQHTGTMALANILTKMTPNMSIGETKEAFLTLLGTIVERYTSAL